MVYSRLVNGYGPYRYKSKREGHTVHSIYLGRDNTHQTTFNRAKQTHHTGLRATHTQKRTAYTTKKINEPIKEVNPLQAEGHIPGEPKKEKIKLKSTTKKETPHMTHLERMHLEAYRKKNGLDKADIDSKLSYEENKTYLDELAKAQGHSTSEIKQNDKEADAWAKEYIQYTKDAENEETEKERMRRDYGIEI